MLLLRSILIISALLLILLQRVDVRITRCERITVKISFTVFALVLTEDKVGNPRPKSLFKYLRNAGAIFRSLKYLLAKTSVIFLRDTTPDTEKRPSFDVLFHFSLIRLIISLLILLYYIVRNKVRRLIKNV